MMVPMTEYSHDVFCDGRNLECLHNSRLLLVENHSAFLQSPLTMDEMPVAAVP